MLTPDGFRCPRTGAALTWRAGALEALGGAVRYPIRDGIPDFRLASLASEDGEDEQGLEALCAGAAATGWRAALARHHPRALADADGIDYSVLLDELPRGPGTHALQIGVGLGAFLAALAERAGVTHGLDPSPGHAHFASLRCRQERRGARLAVGGDDALLPYADARFDVVVIDQLGVGATLARAFAATRSDDGILLAEARRVLRPGGTLLVVAANRFGLGGAGRARAAQPYTASALARLLYRSGFTSVASYWAGPDPSQPDWCVATDADAVRRARSRPGFQQGPTRASRKLMQLVPARWVRMLTPGLAFVARRY